MERRNIELKNILLDSENPRLEEVKTSEIETLKLMIENQNKKISTLMDSIAEDGLNPLDNIGLIQSIKGKYIVVEGNRRVTALKLLNNSELIKNINPSLFKQVQKIISKENFIPIKEVDCIIFKDREEANSWIKLRHTGENGGAGVVKWNALNTRIFDQRQNKFKNKATQFLEIFKENTNLNEEYLTKSGTYKITNLERLISDPLVRDAIGIILDKGEIKPSDFNAEFADKMMLDLSLNQIKVNEIYKQKDRQEYIDKINKKELMPEFTKKEEVSKFIKNDQTIKKSDYKDEELIISNDKTIIKNGVQENILEKIVDIPKEKKVISLPDTSNRKTLIPQNFTLVIHNQKANNLYRELKKAKVSEYPTLISYSFRAFLELGVTIWAKKQGINFSENQNLESKVKNSIEKLEKKGMITSEYKKNLLLIIDGANNHLSIKMLNATVHGNFIMSPDHLKTLWDNYSEFFKIIYS